MKPDQTPEAPVVKVRCAACDGPGIRINGGIGDMQHASDCALAADLALAAAAKKWYRQTQSIDALRSGATPASDLRRVIEEAMRDD